jgi:hypothetical protein
VRIFGRVLSGLHIEPIFLRKPVFGTPLGVVGATRASFSRKTRFSSRFGRSEPPNPSKQAVLIHNAKKVHFV